MVNPIPMPNASIGNMSQIFRMNKLQPSDHTTPSGSFPGFAATGFAALTACVETGSLRSAKGVARTAKGVRNSLAPHSVLRVFLLRSAKGAARTAKRIRNKIAPHSVLRVFLKKRKGCGAHRQADQEQNRAALRFARVP
jgi:hypothetical protein